MSLMLVRKYVSGLLMTGGLLFFYGCNNGSSDLDTLDGETAQRSVVIEGAVHDDVVPFADVTLTLYPKIVLGSVTADANGRWRYEILRSKLREGKFLFLSAINPVNGLEIRSVVNTDEILEKQDAYTAAQTIISHFSEAVVSLMLVDGRLDEFEYEKYMKKLTVKNGVPQETGVPEIDSLAHVIQKNFDDENSTDADMTVDTYTQMVKILNKERGRLPAEETGDIVISLPKQTNKEVEIFMQTDEEGVEILMEGDKAIVRIPPESIQKDITVTVTVSYQEKEKKTTLFIPGKGKTVSDYVFPLPGADEFGFLHVNVFVNGVWYTVVPYMPVDTEFSVSGNEVLAGSLLGKTFQLRMPDGLKDAFVVLRAFKGKDRMGTPEEAIVQSGLIRLSFPMSKTVELSLEEVDDFRPPVPSILETKYIPPVVATF